MRVPPHPLRAYYRLFVRFADGSGGRVQLAPEDFTGVLAPLREPSFFRQVFVDLMELWHGRARLIWHRMPCIGRSLGSGRRRIDPRQATPLSDKPAFG